MSAQIALFSESVYTNHVMNTSFGERLKSLMDSKGISLYRLSLSTGTSENNLRAIIKNKRPASEAVLHQIASVKEMGITFEKLKAWQILGKASQSELIYIIDEISKIQESQNEPNP